MREVCLERKGQHIVRALRRLKRAKPDLSASPPIAINSSCHWKTPHTINMLQRSSRRLLPALSHRVGAIRAYSVPTDNPLPANDPSPKVPNTPISSTNALPTSSEGASDRALLEMPEEGEQHRAMQAPNREGVWSKSQKPRSEAMVGPRFEQTIMRDQVCFHAHTLIMTILGAS